MKFSRLLVAVILASSSHVARTHLSESHTLDSDLAVVRQTKADIDGAIADYSKALS